MNCERSLSSILRRFMVLSSGDIKLRRDHHVNNHEGDKSKRKPDPKQDTLLLGLHDLPDAILDFPDPVETSCCLAATAEAPTNSSALIRGIDPRRVYSLYDPEVDGERIELGLPEAGVSIVSEEDLESISKSNQRIQRVDPNW